MRSQKLVAPRPQFGALLLHLPQLLYKNTWNILPVWPPPACSAGRCGGSAGAARGQSGTLSPAEAHGGPVPEPGWSPSEGLACMTEQTRSEKEHEGERAEELGRSEAADRVSRRHLRNWKSSWSS